MSLYLRGKTWYGDFWYHGQRIVRPLSKDKKEALRLLKKTKTEMLGNEYLTLTPGKIVPEDFDEQLQQVVCEVKDLLERHRKDIRRLTGVYELLKSKNSFLILENQKNYIRRLIKNQTNLPSERISNELIRLKNSQLMLYRQLLLLKRRIHNGTYGTGNRGTSKVIETHG